ncbi:archease [Candidatus Woesearchaeota archaeon]|nr:archease [Candidatus Woesearchaeota archaeon]
MKNVKGRFKFLEDVAIADIAFEAYGKDCNELFENCAQAIFSLTADVKTIKPKIKKELKIEDDKIDGLLYDFLSDILYLKDAEALIFCRCRASISQEKKKFVLNCVLEGDKINPKTQALDNDIKAVTMHMFKVEKIEKEYKATVVVDI